MSAETTSAVPASPELQPADVREELDQEHITHVGERSKPSRTTNDAQRHMGALEDNVTPVMPPITGPGRVTEIEGDTHDDAHQLDPHKELTPG